MAASEQHSDKPCICRLKKTGWPWQATGRIEGQQKELRCRICGATRWVSA